MPKPVGNPGAPAPMQPPMQPAPQFQQPQAPQPPMQPQMQPAPAPAPGQYAPPMGDPSQMQQQTFAPQPPQQQQQWQQPQQPQQPMAPAPQFQQPGYGQPPMMQQQAPNPMTPDASMLEQMMQPMQQQPGGGSGFGYPAGNMNGSPMDIDLLGIDYSQVESMNFATLDPNFEHEFEVIKVEGQRSNKGEPMLKLTLKVTFPEAYPNGTKVKGTTVWDYIVLSPDSLWKSKSLFEAAELLSPEGRFIGQGPQDVEGQIVRARVRNESWNGAPTNKLNGGYKTAFETPGLISNTGQPMMPSAPAGYPQAPGFQQPAVQQQMNPAPQPMPQAPQQMQQPVQPQIPGNEWNSPQNWQQPQAPGQPPMAPNPTWGQPPQQ